jgi:hypothetical protein
MSNHKTTPSTDACILELRARVEALEAQANHTGDTNKMVPPPVATDEELDALEEKLWNEYKTIGYLGEEFMYDSSFGHALTDYRAVLERWGAK